MPGRAAQGLQRSRRRPQTARPDRVDRRLDQDPCITATARAHKGKDPHKVSTPTDPRPGRPRPAGPLTPRPGHGGSRSPQTARRVFVRRRVHHAPIHPSPPLHASAAIGSANRAPRRSGLAGDIPPLPPCPGPPGPRPGEHHTRVAGRPAHRRTRSPDTPPATRKPVPARRRADAGDGGLPRVRPRM
ncbi:hypothetical protein B4N89_41370 [Embleya scabrispora]|uniref:Uncharacterized protein n=1 Tax=Embleya scabrispora TaxID=159449 RepID=A0A1T3NJW5_9ACTN|nr:hypothetical protein B4N89_41370 [Embleya scabrispora]